MISFATVISVFILSVVSEDCSLTLKYLRKETGLREIETAQDPSLMHCVSRCLYGHGCDAVAYTSYQCKLYSTSETYESKGFALQVRNISWPQKFFPWKGRKKKYEHETIVARTQMTYLNKTIPTTAPTTASTTTSTLTTTSTTTTTASTTASTAASTTPTASTATSTTTPTSTTASATTSTVALTTTVSTTASTATSTTTPTASTATSTTTPTSTAASTTTASTSTTASTTTTASTSASTTALTTALASTGVPLDGTSSQRQHITTNVTEEGCSAHKSYSYLSDVGMCVRYVDGPRLTWSDARTYCAVDGGDLVKLNTKMKFESCYSHIKSKGKSGFGSFGVFGSKVWIGLQTSRAESKWVDGSPMTFTKTKKSKSATFMCVQIGRGFLKKWVVKDCSSTSELFLCEIP